VKQSLGTLTGALLVGLVVPSAQQGTDQPPRLRSGVDVVRVEASVLDKNRRPVRGLMADDFVVLENGRERPVAAFAAVEVPPSPPRQEDAADWVDEAPRDVASNDGTDAGRLIVIVFDWSIRSYDQQLARRIALTAVDRLGPSDEATVIFTNPAGTAGKAQGFTADRARLRTAINQLFAVALTSPDPTRNKQILDPR
jgi:VWFA-related protein